ncbi:MAG: hypothetical protein ACO1OB_34870 [Archangium sp.]
MMRTALVIALTFTACAEGPLWEKTDTGVDSALQSIHGLSPTDVWAVGNNGTALHFDGANWSKQATGTSNDLKSVWAASSNDVWVVGSGSTVLRWNGSAFATVPNVPENFDEVLGVDANTVFFCSYAGLFVFTNGAFDEFKRGGASVNCDTLFRYGDGVAALVDDTEVQVLTAAGGSTVLTVTDSYSERSVAVVSPNDVWVVDDSAKSILRHGGTAPRELVLPEDMSVTTMFVRSPTDVWVGGWQGHLAHFDGSELTLKVAGDSSAPQLSGLWGSSNVMFAVGSNGWAMRLVEE